jgi:hypothetical protein
LAWKLVLLNAQSAGFWERLEAVAEDTPAARQGMVDTFTFFLRQREVWAVHS